MNESLVELERVFLALSDKTRIRLIALMSDGEVSVNYLCDSLGESQPKVSRHLAYLRTMGMVKTRRDGKWIYYRLSGPEGRHGSQFFWDTVSWIASALDGPSLPSARTPLKSRQPMEIRPNIDDGEIYGYPDMNIEPTELEVYLL